MSNVNVFNPLLTSGRNQESLCSVYLSLLALVNGNLDICVESWKVILTLENKESSLFLVRSAN